MKQLTALAVLSMMFFVPVFADGAMEKKHIVYLVNSYNPENFGWTKDEMEGIVYGFEQQGMKQGVHYEMMVDTMDALVVSILMRRHLQW